MVVPPLNPSFLRRLSEQKWGLRTARTALIEQEKGRRQSFGICASKPVFGQHNFRETKAIFSREDCKR
jgi:hypothetical protein